MYFIEPFKTRLVAALRSGDYEQQHNELRSSSGFCCLGVVCDLVNPNGWAKDDGTWYFDPGEEQGEPIKIGNEPRPWISTDSEEMPTPIVKRVTTYDDVDSDGCHLGSFVLNAEQTKVACEAFPEYSSNFGYRVGLAEINDAGVPFSEIADFIEEHC